MQFQLAFSLSLCSLESNKETIKNYAIVTKSGGVNGKDKRNSEAEANAASEVVDEDALLSAPPADSATGESSYNYYPSEPHQLQPRYADFSSMVTSAQAKIGRSAEPKPGTIESLHTFA